MENKHIKSPLRYPGGKSRVAKFLVDMFPEFDEYREPFLGGGSVFIEAKQKFKNCKVFWINDLFQDLFAFWCTMKVTPYAVIEEIKKIKNKFENGRDTFNYLTSHKEEFGIKLAASFFALNRMTFSGTTMSGGYSDEAFRKRFTDSSIKRCEDLHTLIVDDNVEITGRDYSELMYADGNNVFIFLDPPYCLGNGEKLYGNRGDLHAGFDHMRFFETCNNCKHKWMITYNDCDFIRNLYADYNITDMNFSYGMSKNKAGKEIIIKNY